MARTIINRVSISNKISGALTRNRFKGIVFNAANARFITAKEKVLKDFNDSEVTKEIEAGASADSSFLSKGNITSFIGLEDGNQSISELRTQLELGIKMNKTSKFSKTRNGVVYEFNVKSPTLEEIYESNPSPWSSKSWIFQIENGVSNFFYYLYSKTGRFSQWSRSGTGLQRKGKRRGGGGGKVLGIKWISEILKHFRSRFNK